MKINLTYGGSSPIENDHLNLDPLADGSDSRIQAHPNMLDAHVDRAGCEQLLARDVIDFFDPSLVDNLITHWVSKLRHGGMLVVGGIDLLEVCNAFSALYINRESATTLLFGNNRRASMTLRDLTELMSNKGLKIIVNRADGFKYTVIGQRI